MVPLYVQRAMVRSPSQLMRMARGKRLWRESIGDFFRKVRCLVKGHRIVNEAYMNSETREIAEYHCGCLFCPLFWTVKHQRRHMVDVPHPRSREKAARQA